MARLRRLLEMLTVCGVAIYLAILMVRPYLWQGGHGGKVATRPTTHETIPFHSNENGLNANLTPLNPRPTEPATCSSRLAPLVRPNTLHKDPRFTTLDYKPLPDRTDSHFEPCPMARPTFKDDITVPQLNDARQAVIPTTYVTSEAPAPPDLFDQQFSAAASPSPSPETVSEKAGSSGAQPDTERPVPPQKTSLEVLASPAVVSVSENSAGQAETIPPPAPFSFPQTQPTRTLSPQGLAQPLIQIELRDADIRDAIHTLARQAGLNVLMSNSVQGKLSLSLDQITPFEALHAVVRAAGYLAFQDGNLLYIGTSQEIKNLEQLSDKVSTRIYRPNYVPAKELESLLKPLVTPQIGLVTVSSAAEKGIAPNPADAGGDAYAGSDVVIVRDYEKVLRELDHIVAQVDIRPRQVAIEAMIISVNIDDKNHFGISFELLRNKGYLKFGWGFVPQDLNDVHLDNSGLKFAYLDASLGAFLNALESIGDTNVIATPRLLVLNKHRAEILIGKELGYVSTTVTETSSSQTVEFLKVGAQLVIRPFISNDGLIRMEVHPEVSTGAVQITNNFTVPNKDTTQVTTNILVPDGATVIIGGLMREDLQTTSSQVPFLGNLPLIGAAFRNKIETTTKQEIIVLLTPRIVDDYHITKEGEGASLLWRRRQRVVADDMSPLGSHSAARRWVEQARIACAEGDYAKARRLAEMAVEFDPNNVEAIMLRDQLSSSGPTVGKRDATNEPISPY